MSPNEPESHLSPMLTTKTNLTSEYRKRAKTYHVTSVPHGHVTARVAEGWEVDKVLKTRTRLRKQKSHDELLEDMVWCLLYKLGYAELSEGRNFTFLSGVAEPRNSRSKSTFSLEMVRP